MDFDSIPNKRLNCFYYILQLIKIEQKVIQIKLTSNDKLSGINIFSNLKHYNIKFRILHSTYQYWYKSAKKLRLISYLLLFYRY